MPDAMYTCVAVAKALTAMASEVAKRSGSGDTVAGNASPVAM